jgi:hypothetical protein
LQSVPETYSKCACTNCGGHIEFPTQGAGATIPCPHCAWPTTLTLPQTAKPSRDLHGTPAVADAAQQSNRRQQIFLLAVVGALLFGAAAFCISRYAPNLIKPVMAAVSRALHPGQSSWENSLPSAANRTLPKGASAGQDTRGPAPPLVPAPPPDPWHGLTCGAIMLEKSKENGLVYAVGNLRNETGRQRFGVKVVLDLFDKKNRKVGSATDYIQWIDPNKEWKFKGLVTTRTAVRAVLASVAEQ